MSEQQQIKKCYYDQIIGALIISTLKYKQFVEPLVDSIKKFFLPEFKINVHLFTDAVIQIEDNERVQIIQHPIESYKFPYATLYRYRIFNKYAEKLTEKYLYYFDADMLCVDVVGKEILGYITVVHHPGFYKNLGWGSNNIPEISSAYIPIEKRWKYVAGGFNGGEHNAFLNLSFQLDRNIRQDENIGVIAEHNDESHLNYWVNMMGSGINLLPPAFCMVEQHHLRVAWGIDDLKPKIIALAKDHELIRN